MTKKWKSIGLAAASLTLVMSACSGGGSSSSGNNASPPSSSGGGSSSTAAPAPSAAPAPADPYGKYDAPVTISTVGSMRNGIVFVNGESFENNVWTRMFEDELNIKLTYDWIVDETQYKQKLNVTMASGDLPDVFKVDKVELQRLIDAGMAADLTDTYESYGSPFLKHMYTLDGGVALGLATHEGRVMAIPITGANGGVSSADMIWLRQDWLEKLGLPAPKTVDDVLKIVEAFAKNDPDGNGQADTYGFGIQNLLYGGMVGSLNGFFNGYHAYPKIWVEGAGGTLEYGSIRPEVKTALAQLRSMYAAGIIDREFTVKSVAKVQEDITAGKVGFFYGNVAAATSQVGPRSNKEADPNAQWQAYPIVSVDANPALPQAPLSATSYYVVSADYKHPEAAYKMLNLWLLKFYETEYESGIANPYTIQQGTGETPYLHAPLIVDPITLNREAFVNVREALAKGDGSHLTYPASLHYERNVKFNEGDPSMWFSNRTFGPEGSFSVVDHYYNENIAKFDAFLGAPTPTMVEKQSTLDKMEEEVFTRIIMGDASLDEFDKFVQDWKSLGGNDMTKEVNDWYSKNK